VLDEVGNKGCNSLQVKTRHILRYVRMEQRRAGRGGGGRAGDVKRL